MQEFHTRVVRGLNWLVQRWVLSLSNRWLHASTRCLTTFFPDDVFLVSFMRSGNTWVRFLVGNLISQGEPVTFANLERVLPEIYLHSNRMLSLYPRPRIIKSHDTFDPRYPRVIYLVRDPRDVAVSLYSFWRKKEWISVDYPIEEFVDRFVKGELSFSHSWAENVASWLATRYNTDRFLLVRYEDILADPSTWLGQIAAFLGMTPSEDKLTRAIEHSSADYMRVLESKEGEKWKVIEGTRRDIPFVGTATSGGWKTSLPEACVRTIELAWGPVMKLIGYELTIEVSAKHPAVLLEVLSTPSGKGRSVVSRL